jgi:hypothetical protein
MKGRQKKPKGKAQAAANRFGGAIQAITKKPEGLRGVPTFFLRITCECCNATAEMPFRMECHDEKYVKAFRRAGWDLWSQNKRAKCSACSYPAREQQSSLEAA